LKFDATREKTRLWLLLLIGVVATLLGQTHARQIFAPSPHESDIFATQTQASTGKIYDVFRYDAPDSLLAAKGTPIKSLADQAADLVQLNGGKARVELRSPSQNMITDLTGASHRGVPTPHTRVAPRNLMAPKQPAYNTSDGKSVFRESTQQDIRTVRRYLERQ